MQLLGETAGALLIIMRDQAAGIYVLVYFKIYNWKGLERAEKC